MMSYQICKEFPAFTPVAVDDIPFFDVVDLYSDLRIFQIRDNRNTKVDKNGNKERIIRKKAGNDWF